MVAMPHSLRLYTRSLTGLLLCAALAACNRPDAEPAEKTARVRVAEIVADGVSQVRYTGVVRARTESNLGFRVAGKVAERLVDPGMRVKRGQPLMRLDPADFELSTASARANTEAARAQQIRASQDEARLRALVGNGAVSRQAYEQSRAAADAARAELTAAQAQARQAANQAQYTVLAADADGVVLTVPVEPGQVVSAGQTVVSVALDGPREAVVALPETAGTRVLNADAPAIATLYAEPDRTFEARLRERSAIADPASRSFEARYTLAGEGAGAPLGATVTLAFPVDADSRHLAVPVGALIDRGAGPGVWRIDPANTVGWQPVTVIHMGEALASIGSDGPVKQGDKVVALGAHLLNEGQAVAPIENAR